MSRFCHLDGALATRDLSHSVEKTWSVPRRFSLNVLRSTILFYRRGGVCPPLYSTAVFTLNTLDLCSFSSLYISTFCSQKVAKTSGTSFASRSRLLLVSYCVTSLIRLLLIARVCRSNLGNKRTRFTHYQYRMAHTLRHFCSFSSIGTDTRCCSTPCRFCF